MRRRAPTRLRLAGLLVLALGCATSTATGLRVAPSSLVLEPTQGDAALTISNTSDRPMQAQVRLFAWSQPQGQEQLVPTEAMAVSPPFVDIAPHQQQRLRVIRLGPAPAEREGSYRIVIDQLPRADVASPQTVLRYSAPVFIAPRQSSRQARLTASVQKQQDGWVVRIENHGNAHARLADLGVRAPDGRQILLAGQLAGYVLPGQFKEWPLPARAVGQGPLQFVARINQDPAHQPLALAELP